AQTSDSVSPELGPDARQRAEPGRETSAGRRRQALLGGLEHLRCVGNQHAESDRSGHDRSAAAGRSRAWPSAKEGPPLGAGLRGFHLRAYATTDCAADDSDEPTD